MHILGNYELFVVIGRSNGHPRKEVVPLHLSHIANRLKVAGIIDWEGKAPIDRMSSASDAIFNSATPTTTNLVLFVYYLLLCTSISSTGDRQVKQQHGGSIVQAGVSCYAGEQSVAFVDSPYCTIN